MKGSFVDSEISETRPTTGSSTKGTSFLERLENKRPKLSEDDRMRARESGAVKKRERVTSPQSDHRNTGQAGLPPHRTSSYINTAGVNYRFKQYNTLRNTNKGGNNSKEPSELNITPVKEHH